MSDLLDMVLRSPVDGEVEFPEVNEARPAPTDALRARLLQMATLEGRFERFVETASRMLDLAPAQTRTLLDRVDSKDSFAEELPGVEFFWLPGGPKTEGAVRGFVRINREAKLPPHTHLGEEKVLVMQGIYVDSETQERIGPGEVISGTPDAPHIFHADDAGTDLLLLVVVQNGYKLGDVIIGPREVPPIE